MPCTQPFHQQQVIAKLVAEPSVDAQIMTTAAENDRPLLTYCRLGKDRTGLMTALVLSTCGATQSEIISDYIRYGACGLPPARSARLQHDRFATSCSSISVLLPGHLQRHLVW